MAERTCVGNYTVVREYQGTSSRIVEVNYTLAGLKSRLTQEMSFQLRPPHRVAILLEDGSWVERRRGMPWVTIAPKPEPKDEE